MRKVRAISPVVAVLLLIIVAVAAVLLIYLWMSGFVGKATRTPAEMKTEFKIEVANITVIDQDQKKANITVYVRNTGTTSLDLNALNESRAVALYVYDSSTGDLVYVNTSIYYLGTNSNPLLTGGMGDADGDGVWEPGEILYIKAVKATGFTKGKYYDIKVVIKGVEDVLTYVKAQ